MSQDESEQILEDLISFLQKTIFQMASSKMILQNNDQNISPDQLSRKLIQVLKNSLSSEREQYLQGLLVKLFQLSNDNNDLKEEYDRIIRSNRRDLHKIRSENEEMERQYMVLQNQIHAFESNKKTKKELHYHTQLQKKQNALDNLHNLLDTAETAQYALKKQLTSIRISMSRLQRGQIKMIQEAKSMCLQQMQESLQEMKEYQKNKQSSRIAKLNRAIQKASNENHQLHKSCESMLNSIWTLTPEGESHPDVHSKDMKNRISEVCAFIDRCVDVEKEKQENLLKNEVMRLIPDIKFNDYQPISDSIEIYIRKKIDAKEKSFQEILRKGAEEEKKLREKLENAQAQIKKLQSSSQSDGFSFDEQFNQQTTDWNQQRMILDQTLNEFEKEKHTLTTASLTDIVSESE